MVTLHYCKLALRFQDTEKAVHLRGKTAQPFLGPIVKEPSFLF